MNKENNKNVRIKVRLSEVENEKLKHCEAECGLSQSEFIRQLCKGKTPKPKPTKDFWKLLETLYDVHDSFKKFAKKSNTLSSICRRRDMATTSLWHIEGRLKDLIDYVENPDKTVDRTQDLQDFYNVFAYVQRPEATEQGEYISAINCLKEIALQQMILTKKQYGKDDGYIAWHGYQSFKPEEVTPEQAHKIGLQLAQKMWGDRFQIIVTTHLDKDHIHNHFCFLKGKNGIANGYTAFTQQYLIKIQSRLGAPSLQRVPQLGIFFFMGKFRCFFFS